LNTARKYYLYIDDSGKFNTLDDDHVIYSFVLFDKPGRKHFFSKAKRFKDNIYSEKKELHGNEFIGRLNRLKKDPVKRANFESLISCYSCSIINGSVIWCKNKSIYPTSNLNLSQELIKKIRMVSIILKKIRENNFIPRNSTINIYLDNEKIKKDERSDLVKYILNEDYSQFSKDIRYLRANRIRIDKIDYLDSTKSLAIQFADIIANVTYKKYKNENDKIKLFFELFKRYSKTIYCIFPEYKYNYDIEELECICL
jgi:hypothetical protein